MEDSSLDLTRVVDAPTEAIRSGVCDVVVAGGVEIMSATRGGNDDTRYGARYPKDLVERFSMPSMGEAAERIAERCGTSIASIWMSSPWKAIAAPPRRRRRAASTPT